MSIDRNPTGSLGSLSNSTDFEDRYLLFWIGQELYGAQLQEVREVLEYQEPKFMPNMAAHFTGVINIRGSIIGVSDLRKKFQQKAERTRSTAFLVCDTPQGAIAAVVDRVDSVTSIAQNQLERKLPVLTQIDQSYVVGIAKIKDFLVTIVKLQQVMSEDKLIQPRVA
jgi:purine-binding chemotaxis protein CheW